MSYVFYSANRNDTMAEEIVNRVAKSGIQTIDLADYFPAEEIVVLDMKDWLFHGLILKEKDFREKLDTHDWMQYAQKNVTITCSTDAIVPLWAYMLFATRLTGIAAQIAFGTEEEFLSQHYRQALTGFSPADYADQRIVIKGCGEKPVPASAYVEITRLLVPYAKAIMYGEPCSTVPVYKKPK